MKKPISRKFTKSKPVVQAHRKGEKPKKQFPSNSRSIPERIISPTNGFIFLVCFFSGVLLMVLLMQENTIRLNFAYLQTLTAERSEVQKQVHQWQQVVTKYPDYRDGYFQLAVLEYQLGDTTRARVYDEKALELDPNFQSGKELEQKIN